MKLKMTDLREIFSANGGNWGGTKVGEALQFVLNETVGNTNMLKFKKENKYDMFELLRNFEVKKRVIDPKKDSAIVLRIPESLKKVLKKMDFTTTVKGSVKKKQTQHEYRNFVESGMTLKRALKDKHQHITLKRDKLQLSTALSQLLFQESTNAICNHLLKIFKGRGMKYVDTILLVGGYSDSPMVQYCMKTTFPRKRLIIPRDASLSVLKGAVIYGHNPALIRERVCKYTYGMACSLPFEDGVHREDYKFLNDRNETRCGKLFDILVRKDESVVVGQFQSSTEYGFGCEREDDKYDYNVYISTEPDPTYTTDDSCTKLGCVILEIPKGKIDIYKDKVQISFTFSGTELEVEAAFEKTGEKVKSYFVFK